MLLHKQVNTQKSREKRNKSMKKRLVANSGRTKDFIKKFLRILFFRIKETAAIFAIINARSMKTKAHLVSATSAIDMLVVRILSPASFAPLPRFRFLSAEKRNSIYNNTAPRFIYLIGLISSFINSRNHSSKASLKPCFLREDGGR